MPVGDGADPMACGLVDEEIFILNALYQHRCINSNHSKNLGEIAKAFKAQFNVDLERFAVHLTSLGYITQKRKIDIKYFISDVPRTCIAINHHGGRATEGRIFPRNRPRRL
ncbi:hypothetical protein [Methanothrix sp.]|uniref:hypothetical protein n=1 Tax=Methanothrix sp. TaxID=90426 RepID=UPI003BB5628F